jgi:hypothetical protein
VTLQQGHCSVQITDKRLFREPSLVDVKKKNHMELLNSHVAQS